MKTLLLIACVAFCVQHVRTVGPLHADKFVKAAGCSGQALKPPHRYHTQSARSSLECVSRCGSEPLCRSADFDRISRLCHFSSSLADSDCSNMEPTSGITHYQRNIALPTVSACTNGGTEDNTGNCTCPEPYCGPSCRQIMEDCQDVVDCGGVTFTGAGTVHLIWPASSPAPFEVLCFAVGTTARTYVAKSTLKTVDFNRSWVDYKNGFGDIHLSPNDHFVGLEKIHMLTANRAYNLRFILKLNDNSMHFGSYPNFAVSSEASGYSFSMFAPPAFPLLDCLTPLEGAPFSTYDNDNDNTGSVNCAAKHGAGFWFQGTSCSAVCNPFGLLTWPAGDARTGVPYEVYWNHDTLGPITPRNMVAFLLNRP